MPLQTLTDTERARMREWLENWRHVGPILEAERWQHVSSLTDDGAWVESTGLLQAWAPEMTGDGGEGLRLQQRVFARWPRRP